MDIKGVFSGMYAIIKYSTKKILFSKKAFIAVLIALFIAAVMGYAATQDVERLEFGTDLLDHLVLFFFMPIIAMVYGSSIIRNEIEDRSITQVLTSPVDRVFSYLAYYISLAISLSVVMLLVITAGFGTFFGQLGVDGNALALYGYMCVLVVVGSCVYSSLFLLVSVVMKRPLYFGLFYAFIWEGFVGSMPGVIKEAAIKHYIRSMGREWIAWGAIANYDASELGYCIQVLLGITVIMIILGMVLFRQKEYP